MKRIEELWDTPVDDSPESEEFEILLALTGAYETKHHSIPSPSPADMYVYHLDRLGMGVDEINKKLRERKSVRKAIIDAIGLDSKQFESIGDLPLKVFTAD